MSENAPTLFTVPTFAGMDATQAGRVNAELFGALVRYQIEDGPVQTGTFYGLCWHDAEATVFPMYSSSIPSAHGDVCINQSDDGRGGCYHVASAPLFSHFEVLTPERWTCDCCDRFCEERDLVEDTYGERGRWVHPWDCSEFDAPPPPPPPATLSGLLFVRRGMIPVQ